MSAGTDTSQRGSAFERLADRHGIDADLPELFADVWEHVARPSAGWSGQKRTALAAAARAARWGTAMPDAGLTPVALEATQMAAAAPWRADAQRVGRFVAELGESRYVALVGLVSCVVAIDTVTQLLGCGVETLPSPQPGDPVPENPGPRLRRRSAWVAMTGPPVPRYALSAVPSAQRTANALIDRLYMTPAQQEDGLGVVRGLTRPQVEIVVVAVSLGNECFY